MLIVCVLHRRHMRNVIFERGGTALIREISRRQVRPRQVRPRQDRPRQFLNCAKLKTRWRPIAQYVRNWKQDGGCVDDVIKKMFFLAQSSFQVISQRKLLQNWIQDGVDDSCITSWFFQTGVKRSSCTISRAMSYSDDVMVFSNRGQKFNMCDVACHACMRQKVLTGVTKNSTVKSSHLRNYYVMRGWGQVLTDVTKNSSVKSSHI